MKSFYYIATSNQHTREHQVRLIWLQVIRITNDFLHLFESAFFYGTSNTNL